MKIGSLYRIKEWMPYHKSRYRLWADKEFCCLLEWGDTHLIPGDIFFVVDSQPNIYTKPFESMGCTTIQTTLNPLYTCNYNSTEVPACNVCILFKNQLYYIRLEQRDMSNLEELGAKTDKII